jgi:DNA-binding transcriptional MerR regulator
MAYRKTPIAARELGISYSQLIGLIRYGKIAPPERDTSGDYIWTDADLDRARAAFASKRRPKREAIANAI